MIRLRSSPISVYRPRQPLESDFHRLVRDHFYDFRDVYGAGYARQYGYWRPILDKTVEKFMRCVLGAAGIFSGNIGVSPTQKLAFCHFGNPKARRHRLPLRNWMLYPSWRNTVQFALRANWGRLFRPSCELF